MTTEFLSRQAMLNRINVTLAGEHCFVRNMSPASKLVQIGIDNNAPLDMVFADIKKAWNSLWGEYNSFSTIAVAAKKYQK